MQLRLASGGVRAGLPGQIRAMLSGADKPGRSPIRTTTQSARSAFGDGIADRDPSLADDDERRDPYEGANATNGLLSRLYFLPHEMKVHARSWR